MPAIVDRGRAPRPAAVVHPTSNQHITSRERVRYDPAKPAAQMVFPDGQWYLDPEGEIRGGIVLDNLIHRGDIPVTIGLFVDPGVFEGIEDPKNRKVEYDAFDDRGLLRCRGGGRSGPRSEPRSDRLSQLREGCGDPQGMWQFGGEFVVSAAQTSHAVSVPVVGNVVASS
jgi:hypothetical protein